MKVEANGRANRCIRSSTINEQFTVLFFPGVSPLPGNDDYVVDFDGVMIFYKF